MGQEKNRVDQCVCKLCLGFVFVHPSKISAVDDLWDWKNRRKRHFIRLKGGKYIQRVMVGEIVNLSFRVSRLIAPGGYAHTRALYIRKLRFAFMLCTEWRRYCRILI